MKQNSDGGSRFVSSVKVGPKGQIVIPKDVRDMFGISPGDTLILFADTERGIALERYDALSRIADEIFSGNAKSIYPDKSEEESIGFAKVIKSLGDEKK